MRRLAIILAAVVVLVGVSGASAAPRPAGHRNCTAGHFDYASHSPAPSYVAQDWESNGCNQQISPWEVDILGVNHFGGWVSSLELSTRASSAEQAKILYLRYRDGPGLQHHCWEIFPVMATGWSNC